jgi:hypothetical protein
MSFVIGLKERGVGLHRHTHNGLFGDDRDCLAILYISRRFLYVGLIPTILFVIRRIVCERILVTYI